jgi:hypothetical protein
MRPIDKNGNEWPAEFSRAKLHVMRAECVTAMRCRDEELSGGRLCEKSGYRPYTVVEDKALGGRYTPQTDLVLIRHKGQDTRRMLAGRWAEFCSQPQDLEAWKKTHLASSRAEEIANMRKFAKTEDSSGLPDSTILDEVIDGVESEADESPEPIPVKRGPGRPRKIPQDARTITAP